MPQLAASLGFRSIIVPWRQCEASGQAIVAAGGWQVAPDGTRAELPLRSTHTPDLISVLAPTDAAFDHGRRLSTACESYWAHLDGNLMMRPVGSDYLFAIVDCRPEWSPLGAASSVHTFPAATDSNARDAFAEHLQEINAKVTLADAVLYRTLAPCAARKEREKWQWFDPVRWEPRADERAAWRWLLTQWLEHARQRTVVEEPIHMPSIDACGFEDTAIHAEHFPEFFNTPRSIDTVRAPSASFVYLDPALQPVEKRGDRTAILETLLCRRRMTAVSAADAEPRLIETGVGRACLVGGLRLAEDPDFHDFTVLGVGLTPFSEGGFVEIGRDIDGKAAMLRAWHRKSCAQRLAAEDCRAARVVAIAEIPNEEIEMPDGTISPAALIVRAFRCVLRVKQLDPIVCALHSPQHTPLIAEYLADGARKLHIARGGHAGTTLYDDDQLAWTVERQPASQASLREIVAASVDHDPRDWPELVRRVRRGVIENYAPLLISMARRRLALEWRCAEADITDSEYLFWFADSLAAQLRAWRRLRFLHDYHHPGFSRWHPETLFSLGENNVTLLAEFADLDTGVFVDDDEETLREILQLTASDIVMLRERYLTFHHRDVQASETVVRTLSAIVSPDDPRAGAEAVERFRRRVDHA